MPVSQNIKSLVALALSDRVLTFKERSTIVETALKEGVPEQEINTYIDTALAERLKYFTKEELKSCPHCGAQIPLIATQCPFCGGELQNIDSQIVPPVFVKGAEADIISAENQRTAAERRNIRTCPDCGAPFPLVSNICEQCGHILHEQQDSVLNVHNLIDNIRHSIKELEQTPQPSFFQVFWYRRPIWLFAISLLILLVAVYLLSCDIYDWVVYSLCAVSLVVFILSAFSLAKIDLDSPVQIAENSFNRALHRQEMYANHIATLYGKNREAQKLLDEFSTLTQNIKKNHGAMLISFWSCLLLVVAAWVVFLSFSKASDYVSLAELPPAYNYFSVWEDSYPIQMYKNEAERYLSVDGDAELSIDVSTPQGYVLDKFNPVVNARLRLSGLTLSVESSMYDKDIVVLLYDNDHAPVATMFGNLTVDWDYSLYGYYFDDLMKIGSASDGRYYAEFISKQSVEISDDGFTIDSLRQILSGAKYYSLYVYDRR
ncbi:MAG: zinc ribbon domain-containing protein [Bacteroidales bacterium]|nr:zinc ribbon domain-containing protein [Bacteroidales bacterium]